MSKNEYRSDGHWMSHTHIPLENRKHLQEDYDRRRRIEWERSENFG